MKDYDKEIENIFLDEEEDILQRIRIVYQNALKDVQAYAKSLQKELDELLKKVDPNDEIGLTKIRSKVYQLEYQKKLAQQINNYLDVIKDKDVNNITDYINKVYSNGFLTEQYRLMRSGIDITMPINQKLLKKAVTFNIDDIPLSTRLYTNVDKAKKEIINEISRGLSIGMSVSDMARNLQNTMGVSMRKAYQIAQNEGARVRQSAIIDSMREAKKKGADIVKQWSATLDGKTRPVHQELDGEWAEIEDDFKYSGGKVFAPKQFGIPSEDINCRCTLLSVPRWDIEDKHWQLDNERKELVKVKNYEDWYSKIYLPNNSSKQLSNDYSKNKKFKLENDELGNVFISNNKNKRNTQILVDYINSQDVSDNVKKIFKGLNDEDINVSYGKNNKLDIAQNKIVLRDLTEDNEIAWVDINIHELTHLKDHFKAIEGDMFSRQKRFMDVVKKTSPSMSEEIKKVIDSAKIQYKSISEMLSKECKNKLEEINDNYFKNKYNSYKEYLKEFNASKKYYKDRIEAEQRNVGVHGLEDIYDALSGGTYRDNGTVYYGHGSKYYANDLKRISEILADYVQLSVSRQDLIELLKKDKPDLTNMLDNLIDELVK